MGIATPLASPDCQASRKLASRCASAVRRRAAWAFGRLRGKSSRHAVPASMEWLRNRIDLVADDAALVGGLIPTVLNYGQTDLADRLAARLLALQHEGASQSSSPIDPVFGKWTERCSASLAHRAVGLYKLGQRVSADRLMAKLRRRQLPSGGFPPTSRRAGETSPECMWAVKHFLDASRAQVRQAFRHDPSQRLPTEIGPTDGRFRAVQSWLASLPECNCIADVGCGPGRFLRRLATANNASCFLGIDPAASLLESLPTGVARRCGDLLNIPATTGECDGAFAVESLEHSLLPERAIDELCRIVRPGGGVLIIDKHATHQPLSEHAPWEQWFMPDQVACWLTRHCDQVTVKPVAHGDHQTPTGLFLCWQGRRREEGPRG